MRKRPLALLTTLATVTATFASGATAQEIVLAPDGSSKAVVESETGSYIVVMDNHPVVVTVGQDGLDTPAAQHLAQTSKPNRTRCSTRSAADPSRQDQHLHERAQRLLGDPHLRRGTDVRRQPEGAIVLPDELHHATPTRAPNTLA